ncbi:CW-type Zinc Finger [Forsythia ovata]|uniref:CW-type Zinc Finger n=1 Tax=Forsythia ovata TaxID=205694 RepID=A0ABD1VD94_9LAMI
MITVDSRDGRKELGLGRDVEGAELEEGEAYCNHLENEDSTIDPDVALSYIEEKLQNILGHFQKDFEGGVSAENLGAKFGGYGSFLPTYQRSPSRSYPRNSQEVHNYDAPKSPKKLHLEDGRQNSLASSNMSLSARPSLGKTASFCNSLQGDICVLPTHAKESTSNCRLVKSSANPSDKRTLKVRIKVGSENLSTQKNAQIYSGLGLDISPSPSFDDSPTTSEGLCGNLQDVPDKSPTNILQMMTSLPVDLLLSPLSEDLILLTGKGKFKGKSEHIPVDKASLDSPGMSVNGSHFSRSNQKVLERKKWKSSEKDDAFSTELTSTKNNSGQDNIGILLKKKTDMDMFDCEKLVTDAMKLPLLSNLEHSIEDPTKCNSREAVDVPVTSLHDKVKEETFSEVTVKGLLESVPAQDIGRVKKLDGRLGSSGKVLENKNDVHEAEKVYSSPHSESNVCEGRSSFNGEAADPTEQSVVEKGKSGSEEGMNQAHKKQSSGKKKKSKGIHGQGVQGSKVSKDQSMIDSSTPLQSGKSSHANSLVYKHDQLNLQKDQGKPGDRYKDFFGDLEFEEEDKDSVSGEMTSARKLKNSQLIEKSTIECHSTTKEKCKGKKAKKPSFGKECPRGASSVAPPSGNGPVSNATATGVVPLVNEDWVSCDKCQKWRLLPLGTNPKSLPDKWLCRMLTWLPGMNRCSIPEEVTTSALRALYHPVPASAPPSAPESQPNRLNCPAGISSGWSSIYASSPGQDCQNIVSQAAIINRKKHRGSAGATNSTDLDRPTHNSQSQKKNLQTSGKSSILDGTDDLPVDSCRQQYSSQPSSDVEKNEDCKKENRISLDNCSDRGTNSKTRNKRESGLDCSRASKRTKTEDVDDAASLKAGHSSSSGLSNNASGNDHHCKDARVDTKKNVASLKNSEFNVPGTSDGGLLCTSKCDNQDTVKKRKGKEYHGSQVLSSTGPHPQAAGGFVEETCESDYWKEKKARISTSGGKDTGRIKASERTERKDRDTISNNLPKCSLEAADYLRSDMDSVHPFAANSSSSKVSGSLKSKLSGQEMKGSPIESVSSSPLRDPNTDKFTSTGRKLVGKVDFQDLGSLTSTSPGRFLHGEDDGNDRSGKVKKSATLTITNCGTDVYDGRICQGNQNACETHTSEQCQDEERRSANHSQVNGSHSEKSCKGFSSRSKDKSSNSRSDLDKTMNNVYDSSELDHMISYEGKSKSGRSKFDEKCATPDEAKKNIILKKDGAGGISRESSKGKSQLKLGGLDGSDGRLDVMKSLDKKNHLQPDHGDKRLSKKLYSGKGDRAEVNGSGKSHSAAKVQIETVSDLHRVSGSQMQNGVKVLAADLCENGNALKTPKQSKKAENQNGQPIHLRHPTPNKHKVRGIEAPSPVRRDSSTHTANSAIKEAKDLKHLADRLKNSESTESTGLYFQAALKFLHGASLLESGNSEGTKHNEMIQSMNIYSSTAKLCEFCAHEYEKSKDMATAALAYKCMEVAYMRVVYCSHTRASRDRKELQSALQIVFPGESPSSSASDVDNFNGQATVDKAALAKFVGSPQVSGSHVITAQNRSSFMRLLNFAQDTNFAMEASRKSRIAFAAASRRPGETQDREGICFLKKALDFNFQEVDGLLHLVRVAMEAISR